MITQDDIERLCNEMPEAEKVAEDYVKKSRLRFPNGEPYPSDRWVDGHSGAEALARAVETQTKVIKAAFAIIDDMMAAQRAAGEMSMSLGPSRPKG